MVMAGILGGYISSFSKGLMRGETPAAAVSDSLCVASLRRSWRGCLPSGHSGSPLLLLAVIVLLPVAGAMVEQTQLPNAEPRRRLQTALTNANILAAVDACLAEDPIYMVCPNTEYGDAADWDVGDVTNFDHALSANSARPGGAAASTQFVGGSVFSTWNVSGATSFEYSACSLCTRLLPPRRLCVRAVLASLWVCGGGLWGRETLN
eukprot:COSAG05_NODE_3472_length_2039_cov_7.464948_1_plen_207_part_00